MGKTIIFNADIINEGTRFDGYIIIDNDIIVCVGEGNPDAQTLNGCKNRIDAENRMLIPGVIDDHVHFRDPGLTHKADMSTESHAAVAGGVTSYMDMPNTKPQTTTIEALENKFKHASETSLANYSFFIGATNDNIDELSKVDYSQVCGIKAFLGSSTGNMLINDEKALHRLFSESPTIIAVHAEDEATIAKNMAHYRELYNDDVPISCHPLIRDADACYICTANAVELAKKCGTRLHVAHLSTEKELSLFTNEPLTKDKKITAEVCVQHLWFADKDYEKYGARIKCNPAIKSETDRNALRNALNNGVIDIVATDHAPHLLSEKEGNCLKATSGIPLIQFSLVAMLEMVNQGIFSIERVVEAMCHKPADLYRIVRRGYLRLGYYADFVLIDKDKAHTVTTDDIYSKCNWSPFEGTTFHNSVYSTYVNGIEVYHNGTFNETVRGKKLEFQIS